MKEFTAWCDQVGIQNVNVQKSDISAYIYYLKNEKLITSGPNRGTFGCSPQTVDNHRRVLNCFFNWCIKKGWLAENPVAHIQKIRHTNYSRRMNPFTPEEVNRLYDSCDDSLQGLRNKLIASFFYDAGRCCEIPKAKMSGLNLDEGWLEVETKHHKTRTVRLSERTISLLREYLPKRERHLDDLLARRKKEKTIKL